LGLAGQGLSLGQGKLIGLLAALLITSCRAEPAPVGLEVTLQADLPAGAFQSLAIRATSLQLHPADQPRDAGWRFLPLANPEIDLTKHQARQSIGQWDLPGLTFDRIWLRVESADGQLIDGRRPDLTLTVEPISLDPSLPPGRPAQVTLTLIVLPLADPSGLHYEMFTRSARVEFR
jgi:hypothetical protein